MASKFRLTILPATLRPVEPCPWLASSILLSLPIISLSCVCPNNRLLVEDWLTAEIALLLLPITFPAILITVDLWPLLTILIPFLLPIISPPDWIMSRSLELVLFVANIPSSWSLMTLPKVVIDVKPCPLFSIVMPLCLPLISPSNWLTLRSVVLLLLNA